MRKRLLILSTLIIFTLSIIIIIFFSYEKKNVSYALKVPEGLAIYIYNDSTQKYEKKSKVPHGYVLNESKTYCESGGEVINYNAYEEYVNYALATGDKCHLYFDRYLPEGYTKLEYIQRTDGQYINTGVLVSGSASTQVEVDWMYTALNNYGTIIGTQGGNHNYILREENGTNIMRVWGGGSNVELGKVVVGQKNSATIMWGNGKVSASLVLGNRTFNANTTMTTENASAPLLLFDSNVDGQIGSSINADIIGRAKMYKCNIWINGELEREFVPALDTDGIAGMYDRVEKKFYANAGTGQFKYAISGDELPPEYTQLEYLESTGTQYIDTGWKSSSINFQISSGFMITGDAVDQTIFGASETHPALNLMVQSSQQIFQFGIGGWQNTAKTDLAVKDKYLDVYINSVSGSQRYYVNGQELSVTNVSPNQTQMYPNHTVAIFTNHYGSASANRYYATARMYYFKVVESGKLVRNMIPALNNDGIPGMYDTVEGKFYTNAGTGQFKYNLNNNRLPNGYTPVSYIESSGTQYIDTGFVPNQKTSILAITTPTSVANSAFFAYGGAENYDASAFEFYTWTSYDQQRYQVNFGNSILHTNNHLAYANQKTIISQKKNITRIVNETDQIDYVHPSSVSFTSPYSIYLFALHRATITPSQSAVKMHTVKIWDDEVLVRDMVPCINPYGEVGMYDVVNNKFYGNVGTGVFKSGASSEYTTLNYIQSTGTQYIDTGYSAPEGFYTEFDTVYTSVYGGYIVGSHNLASPYGRNGIGPQHTNFWEIGTGDTCPAGTSTITANTRYHVEASTVKGNSYATVNGTSEVTTTDSSSRSSFNLLLFYNQYSQNTGGDTLSARLYYLKIWDENHELVRVFIPAKNSAGTVGLYEALTGNFYTNAGSGTFASG